MPKRTRYRAPDGLDWRDPAMPVIRHYRMADGTMKTEVDPGYEHRYREMLMLTAPPPDFDKIERRKK